MTVHHGSATIYSSYAHLNLFPESLSEPQEYFVKHPKKGPLYPFGGRIVNMDTITEQRLLISRISFANKKEDKESAL